MYDHSLGALPGLLLPRPAADVRHVYHQYVIRLPKRDALREHLRARANRDSRALPGADSFAAGVSGSHCHGRAAPGYGAQRPRSSSACRFILGSRTRTLRASRLQSSSGSMVEPTVEPGGLSPREVELMRSVEDELWWYQALRAHVINSLPSMLPTFQLLDAGCGTGGMLARIRQHFPQAKLTGIDLSESGLELTRQRQTGAELLRASTNSLPLPGGGVRCRPVSRCARLPRSGRGGRDTGDVSGAASRRLTHHECPGFRFSARQP